MRRLPRRAVVTAACLALVVAASGCGAGQTAGAGDKTTLSVVMWKGGGSEEANVGELNRRFEAANPDIKVDFKFVKRGDYDAYNSTRFNAGTAADVLMVDPSLVKQWARAGQLADLSDQSWVDGLAEQIRPFATVDGKTFQFIQEVPPVGLFVNLDLLKSVGVTEAPANWPAFVAALEKLKAAGKNGFLMGNKGGWSAGNAIQLASVSTVLQTNPKWNEDFNAKRANFNPDWREPLARTQELLTKGFVDGKTMLGIDPWGDALNRFKSGDWAFTIQGAWMMTDFVKNAKFELAFVPYPANVTGQPIGYEFVGTGLAVNAKSKVLDAARKYLAFWAQPQHLARYLEAESALTPLSGMDSPLGPQAKAFVVAQSEGRLRVAPPQHWEPPTGEDPFSSVGQRLFVDPGGDLSKLLNELDAAFGPVRK